MELYTDMRCAQTVFNGIILEETIAGAGDDWYTAGVISRIKWLDETIGNKNYIVWYAGLRSDTMYIKFRNDQDATLYKLTWITADASNQ